MTISSITNLLNYCVIFTLCVKFKYLAADPGLDTPRLACRLLSSDFFFWVVPRGTTQKKKSLDIQNTCRLLLDESVIQQPHLSVYIDLREEAAISN
jgi:hypothetical protein